MDFLIDQDLLKTIKPLVLGLLGIGTIVALNFGFSKLSEEDDDDQQNNDDKQQKNKKDIKKPSGIFNQGNTCFVNSLLQALGSLDCFINNLNQLIKRYQSNISYDQKLLIELRNGLIKINEGTNSVNISQFLELLAANTNLINFEQQDAYELYSTLITSFQRVNNQQKILSLSRSTFNNEDDENNIIANNSLLGYTKSSITCTGCKSQKNIKIHPFYDLSFDIGHPAVKNIRQALDKYQQKEVITGWICVKCSIIAHTLKIKQVCAKLFQVLNNNQKSPNEKERVQYKILLKVGQAIIKFCKQSENNDELEIQELNMNLANFITQYQKQYSQIHDHPKRDSIFVEVQGIKKTIYKQTVISKFPKILVLHLKQLGINPFTGQPVLLRKFIDFSEELAIPVRSGEKKYKLTSLLSHVGNQSMGHYYTYRKLSGKEQEWYIISDTFTKQCKWENLKSGLPYMLFFEITENIGTL